MLFTQRDVKEAPGVDKNNIGSQQASALAGGRAGGQDSRNTELDAAPPQPRGNIFAALLGASQQNFGQQTHICRSCTVPAFRHKIVSETAAGSSGRQQRQAAAAGSSGRQRRAAGCSPGGQLLISAALLHHGMPGFVIHAVPC